MSFRKKIDTTHNQDGSILFVYDDTLDYQQDDFWGWGKGDTPINREDYVLLCFVKYINHAGISSYLEHVNQFPNIDDRTHGLADGNGLANTDRSVFTMKSPNDGHHIVYLIHLEKDSTRFSGSAGDVYYNVGDDRAYYHDGAGWNFITGETLNEIENISSARVCEYLFPIRIIRWQNEAVHRAYSPKKQRDVNLINMIRDIKALLTEAFNNFVSSKDTSRFLINAIIKTIDGK